jgi:hypothetical protein
MAGFIGGLTVGLICTATGVYVTWLRGKSDRRKATELADAQAKIAQLEEEKRNWQVLERFAPRIAVAGAPPNNQFIMVTNSAPFRVVEIDYLTAEGIKVTGHSVDRTGRGIQVPIDESKVTEVQKQGCDPSDGSFPMSFRIHVEFDGMTKAFLLPVTVAVNSALKLEPMPLGIHPPKK